MSEPVWNPEAGGPNFRLECNLAWPREMREDAFFMQAGPLGVMRRLREMADAVERAYPPHSTCLCPNPHCGPHGTAMPDFSASPMMQVREALDVASYTPWEDCLKMIHNGTQGPPKGCCSRCDGRGGDETGPCHDCRQTGHPHAPEVGCS